MTDPRNFGACLRVADAAGVQCVLVPRDRSAHMSPAALKAAAGAAETVPVVTVTNLAASIVELRDAGVTVVGTAGEATKSIYEFDQKKAFALGARRRGRRPAPADPPPLRRPCRHSDGRRRREPERVRRLGYLPL